MLHRPRRGIPQIVLFALAIGLALLIAGGVGVWRLARPPLDRFIVPEAVNVQVQPYGFGEQRITYRTAGAPYAWYFQLARNLAADGWSGPIDNRTGIRRTPEIHWRISQLGPIYLKEEVWLQGDPHIAQIRVYREIIIPWRRYIYP